MSKVFVNIRERTVSMQRRTLVSGFGCLCLGAMGLAGPARHAWAQRPANPIALPPRDRPDRPAEPGRFNPSTSDAAAGPSPGLFTVVAVDTRASTIQLRDAGDRSGTVYVDPDMIDLETLKAGDLVEVDFLVPEPGSTKLAAASIWRVQR
jgi:hypothetical protein